MSNYKRSGGTSWTPKPEKSSKQHKHLLTGKRRADLYKKGGR